MQTTRHLQGLQGDQEMASEYEVRAGGLAAAHGVPEPNTAGDEEEGVEVVKEDFAGE